MDKGLKRNYHITIMLFMVTMGWKLIPSTSSEPSTFVPSLTSSLILLVWGFTFLTITIYNSDGLPSPTKLLTISMISFFAGLLDFFILRGQNDLGLVLLIWVGWAIFVYLHQIYTTFKANL